MWTFSAPKAAGALPFLVHASRTALLRAVFFCFAKSRYRQVIFSTMGIIEMPEDGRVGFRCKCGMALAVPGLSLVEGESLEAGKRRLRGEDWRLTVSHLGCELGEANYLHTGQTDPPTTDKDLRPNKGSTCTSPRARVSICRQFYDLPEQASRPQMD